MQTPVDYSEIKPVGMSKESQRLTGIGYANGKILDIKNDRLVGQVFFEVHPDHLQKTNDIVVDLYGNIELGFSDCAEVGTLLGRARLRGATGEGGRMGVTSTMANKPVGFHAGAYPFPSYNSNYQDENAPVECHPRFAGAIVGAAEFEITDPFEGGEGSVWFPREDNANAGLLRYCVRVRVQPKGIPPMENKADTYHYIDTKFKIQGNRNAPGFANPNNIRVYTNQEFASKEAHVASKAVGVRAFLCGLPPTEDGGGEALVSREDITEDLAGISVTRTKSFGIGEEFTICVGPDNETSDKGYEVVGFADVVCENDGQRRQIVTGGEPDPVTTVETSTVGHLDYTTLAETGTEVMVMHPGTLGVRTAVTTGWVQRGDRTVTCLGVARVRERGARRQLRSRGLQETMERKERGDTSEHDFTIEIPINNSTVYSRGEVPYPGGDGGGGGTCKRCKSTFLGLFIFFLLVGGGGLVGWWWWENYGQDMMYRRSKAYSQCGMLEDICGSDTGHSDHLRKPFEDGTSDDATGSRSLRFPKTFGNLTASSSSDEDDDGDDDKEHKDGNNLYSTAAHHRTNVVVDVDVDDNGEADISESHFSHLSDTQSQSLAESMFADERESEGERKPRKKKKKKGSKKKEKRRKRKETETVDENHEDEKQNNHEETDPLSQSLNQSLAEPFFADENDDGDGDDDVEKPRKKKRSESGNSKKKKKKRGPSRNPSV